MRLKLIAVGIAAVMAVAVVATASAFGGGGGPFGIMGGGPEKERAEYAKDLASELGIDSDRVADAMKSVDRQRREAHQDEMAKALAGKLDVSQADAERALEQAERTLRNGDRGRDPRRHHDAFLEAIAKALDKETDEVRDALQEIRTDKLKADLAAAVKSGRLSKEQADRIRERIESGDFGPPGHGGRGPGPGGPGAVGPGPGGPGFELRVGPPRTEG